MQNSRAVHHGSGRTSGNCRITDKTQETRDIGLKVHVRRSTPEILSQTDNRNSRTGKEMYLTPYQCEICYL